MIGFRSSKARAVKAADPQTSGGGAHGARHVAIIMDGNGRWAKKKHLARALGPTQGVYSVGG
ncbi:MAG: isoprenyl transferase, partial [Sphingomonadales bacterium]